MDATQVARQRGFTFPELVVVGVMLLIFIGTMLVIVRPTNYEPEHRNAQRRLGLAAIMKAITTYKTVAGTLPPTITDHELPIASYGQGRTLCDDLVPTFLDDIPLDPVTGDKLDNGACNAKDQVYDSGYTVRVENGKVILSAPAAEHGDKISVERWFPIL